MPKLSLARRHRSTNLAAGLCLDSTEGNYYMLQSSFHPRTPTVRKVSDDDITTSNKTDGLKKRSSAFLSLVDLDLNYEDNNNQQLVPKPEESDVSSSPVTPTSPYGYFVDSDTSSSSSYTSTSSFLPTFFEPNHKRRKLLPKPSTTTSLYLEEDDLDLTRQSLDKLSM